jgi:hypothetical protein
MTLAKGFDSDALFPPQTREAFHSRLLSRTTATIDGKAVIGYAGGNDYGFNAVVIQVPEDDTAIVAASRTLSAATAEIVGIEVLQVLYGAVLELPED